MPGSKHRMAWFDTGQMPTVKPNPKYPDGIDLDLSKNSAVTCVVNLPYPARRIGHYVVECDCGQSVLISTAGRRDDPRSVKLACKRVMQ